MSNQLLNNPFILKLFIMQKSFILLCILNLFIGSVHSNQSPLSYSIATIDQTSCTAVLSFKLNPQEILYKDSLSFSVDHPDIAIQKISPKQESIKRYDATLNETVHGYVDAPCFEVVVAQTNEVLQDPAHLHCMYHINTHAGPAHQTFALPRLAAGPSCTVNAPEVISQDSKKSHSMPKDSETSSTWSQTISSILESTKSLPLRLFLVFILGLMLSLTPCIYPMIP